MYKKPIHAGVVPSERLSRIPDKYKLQHEFCFLIHNYMETLIVEAAKSGAADVPIAFKTAEEAASFERLAKLDVLHALESLGYESEALRVGSNQVSLRLFEDMLHFISEGLIALENRKFIVALVLLRKPFKENLFLAAWLCGDALDFHRAFDKAPDKHMSSEVINKNKRIDIFRKAIKSIDNYNMFESELLYKILYDKNLPQGLSNIFDQATHLVTSSNPLMRTERRNLNFIFKDPMDDDIYEFLYFRLSYVLIFAFQVQCSLFDRFKSVETGFKKYASLVFLGTNNCLYHNGNYFPKFLSKTFKEFATCPHCKADLKFRKLSTARLLMAEQITCEACLMDSHFPLHWLMSKFEWDLTELNRKN